MNAICTYAFLAIFISAVIIKDAECMGPYNRYQQQSRSMFSRKKPDPCDPPTPKLLQDFQKMLPANVAQHVTPENLKTLEGVAKLSALSAAAATGNPVAIAGLAAFLTSPDSPVPAVKSMSGSLLSYVNPVEYLNFWKKKPVLPPPKKHWFQFGKNNQNNGSGKKKKFSIGKRRLS